MLKRLINILSVQLGDADLVVFVGSLRPWGFPGLMDSIVASLSQDVSPIEQLGFVGKLVDQGIKGFLGLVKFFRLHQLEAGFVKLESCGKSGQPRPLGGLLCCLRLRFGGPLRLLGRTCLWGRRLLLAGLGPDLRLTGSGIFLSRFLFRGRLLTGRCLLRLRYDFLLRRCRLLLGGDGLLLGGFSL